MEKRTIRTPALIVSAAFLLFACGSEQHKLQPAAQASKSLSLAGQCSEVATIAAGLYHTVGLKEDGTVVPAGNNDKGQLDVTAWTNINAVAAGRYHTVGLEEDGTVVAAGNNDNRQLNVTSWTNINAIAAGRYHTVGLKADGTVLAVGYNNARQLSVTSWTNINAIAAGASHTVGLRENGTVVAVGSNSNGQLNVSTWTDIQAIAAGASHTVGLRENGTVVVAADNNIYGEVAAWTNIRAIAAGASHTVGLRKNGTVATAGSNSNGQLNVSAWTNIRAIAAGEYHTVGLKDDGTVVVVGFNGDSQQSVVSSWTNIMPVCGPVDAMAGQDVTSPTTTAIMSGTQGNNGWYVSDVQMTLIAADDGGGSGVKEIHYTVDGIENVVPGCSASYLIAGDGAHSVIYYATDNAGNMETPPQRMSVNIDKTPPEIASLAAYPAVLWPPNHEIKNVLIGGSATDYGSGVATTTIVVADEYGIHNMTATAFGTEVPLESWRAGADRDGRIYAITAIATDAAGNRSTATTTVTVPHDRK
jgi:alpha-tubulin suppressor-like RCC1 family protein